MMATANFGWRVVKRQGEFNRFSSLLVTLLAIMLSFLASALLLFLTGADVGEAFSLLLEGAFGDQAAVVGSLKHATPLLFAGLSAGFAFRARIWNVGQEGQIYAGAMLAYWVSTLVQLPWLLMVPLVLLAGFTGGALLGAASSILKTRFRVAEIVSTVMFNYLIVLLLSYLLTDGLWMEPGQYYMQTPRVAEEARLPNFLPGINLHVGFLLAIAALFTVHLLLKRVTLGFSIRAFGSNPEVARFRGVDPNSMVFIVLVISGGLAGLAGVAQTFGVDFRLTTTALQGIGATGLIVGVIAGMRPLGIGIAALLFGGLAEGSMLMEVIAGVSSAIVTAMQAIILIIFISTSAIANYRLTRTSPNV